MIFFIAALIQISFAKPNCTGLSVNNLNFSAWDKVLRRAVIVNQNSSGIGLNIFNYSDLTDNADYEMFKCQVENADVFVVKPDTSNENKFLAFWINVYNYMAVSIMFENKCKYDMFGYCSALTSIREIGQEQPAIFPTQTWDLPWLKITTGNVSKMYSLNDVEHEHLRCPPGNWSEDVRIHAAIVCASVSCPNIRNSAYLDAFINENLTSAITDFFSDANKLKGVDIINDQLWVSQIFSFFPNDFDNSTPKQCGNPIQNKTTNCYNISWLLQKYAPARIVNWIKNNSAKANTSELNFFNYNWNLNGDLHHVCSHTRLCFAWWEGTILLFFLIIVVVFVVFFIRSKSSDRSKQYEKIVNEYSR